MVGVRWLLVNVGHICVRSRRTQTDSQSHSLRPVPLKETVYKCIFVCRTTTSVLKARAQESVCGGARCFIVHQPKTLRRCCRTTRLSLDVNQPLFMVSRCQMRVCMCVCVCVVHENQHAPFFGPCVGCGEDLRKNENTQTTQRGFSESLTLSDVLCASMATHTHTHRDT